jgi:hypothetical protein
LIGYEWTSNNGGNNLHRVVIFRDGREKADQIVPFSAFDSDNPAMLWKFLDGYTEKTGGEVLAIPHNGNLSNGRMFALVDFDGRGLTRAYAETRARLEPVYGNADEGRRRGAPVPVAKRRVRWLRALGQGQSRSD